MKITSMCEPLPPQAKAVSEERLRELADILDNGWERDGDTENEMRDALRELLALRAEKPRWVEWKAGDALPKCGWYWTSKISRSSGPRTNMRLDEECYLGTPDKVFPDGWNTSWRVIAYWSAPLPPPYAPEKEAK